MPFFFFFSGFTLKVLRFGPFFFFFFFFEEIQSESQYEALNYVSDVSIFPSLAPNNYILVLYLFDTIPYIHTYLYIYIHLQIQAHTYIIYNIIYMNN